MKSQTKPPKCKFCRERYETHPHNYKLEQKGEIVIDVNFCSIECMDQYLVSIGRNPIIFDPKKHKPL